MKELLPTESIPIFVFSKQEVKAISVRQLTERQMELMREHKPDVYVFFAYSTQVWDEFNDHKMRLRQKSGTA